MQRSSRPHGLTIVETLIVLAILAVVGSAAHLVIARSSVHRDAAALASSITSARWLAVTSGVPVAIVRNSDGTLYRRIGRPLQCGDGEHLGMPIWAPTRRLVLSWPASGLAFGAVGRPLRCDGSAVGNVTITLTGRDGSRAAVIVASLGRVRWERR